MIEAVELAAAAGVREGLVEDVAQGSGALSDLTAFTLPFYRHFRDDPHAPEEDEVLRVTAALVDKDLSDAVELASGARPQPPARTAPLPLRYPDLPRRRQGHNDRVELRTTAPGPEALTALAAGSRRRR